MNMSFSTPAIIGLEVVYSIIITVLCLLIYHKTKEMYKLTKDKGLWYFRNSFLFYALAYVFRFFLLFLRPSSITSVHDLPIIAIVLLFATGYSSTIAIIYLAMSVLWKRMGRFKSDYVIHGIAFIISIIAFASWKRVIKKKHFVITSIYVLLFIFWVANLMSWGPPGFPHSSIRIILRVISVTIFFVIFYKVFKWTR